MRSITELTNNPDGTWTARVYATTYTGTYEQCVEWLRANCDGQWP